jgi:hypothetical protein
MPPAQRKRALLQWVGAWKRRADFDVETYIRSLRKGNRLRALQLAADRRDK